MLIEGEDSNTRINFQNCSFKTLNSLFLEPSKYKNLKADYYDRCHASSTRFTARYKKYTQLYDS